MPSVMVYTEETFYYEGNIHVVAREEYMHPEVTELSFFLEEGFWFGFEAPYSIYTMQGLEALVAMKLKQYGKPSKFKYSRKKIEYSYSEKNVLDSVAFYITKSDHPGILSVMEEINHSKHLRSWNIQMAYDQYTEIRQYTDSVFYGMFQQQQ